jgi:prepilin-type N-terminal cleavage/methylation domain-containing protein
MKKFSGFSVFELLVVILIFSILATLAVLTLAPHQRMVKTEDGAGAVYNLMRQARIQAITRRQFYAVVINAGTTDQTLTLNNSNVPLQFLAQSVTLVDMGSFMPGDESIALSKKLPIDVNINAAVFPSPNPQFPVPEQSFNKYNFSAGPYICYFDPAGRAVNSADNNGTQNYAIFYFSSFDITPTQSPTLLRAVTLYGATGGLKFWRFLPAGQWITQLS